jgi:hypothetical protein
LKYSLIKKSLRYAIDKIEKAWMPPESEKKSTRRPNKKLKKRKGILFSFNGYTKIKAIYK